MFQAVIYDTTSGANAALDTGTLNLQLRPIDAVLIEVNPSAAMVAANIQLFDPDLSTNELVHFSSTTSATPVLIGWGLGISGAAIATTYLGGLNAPLPPKIRVLLPALGNTTTGRLRIIGVRLAR